MAHIHFHSVGQQMRMLRPAGERTPDLFEVLLVTCQIAREFLPTGTEGGEGNSAGFLPKHSALYVKHRNLSSLDPLPVNPGSFFWKCEFCDCGALDT